MGKRTNTAKWMAKQRRWQINVQKDGVRKSFYSSTPGRIGQRECNSKADAWLDDHIDNGTVRVSALFAEYVETLKLTTSKSNWTKINYFGDKWILPKIGTLKISNVNEQHLQDVINSALSAGLSKKTLTNLRATLMSFIKYCRKRKVTILFPENLTIPQSAKSAIKRILQPQDVIKLMSTDTTILYGKTAFDSYVYAYRFQVLTGLRPGELIGLEWSDIVDDMVYVKRSINSFGEVTSGKNDNAVRHFALSNLAKDTLKKQREVSSSDSVFEIVSLSSYQKKWKHYCESNGITHVSPYEMRHTFISIAKNLSDGQIKPLIGHSKNMDTFSVYGHEVNGELRSTASDLNNIFGQILKSVL